MNVRNVPHKANHALHLILIAFLMILFRVWFLATLKHEEYHEKALKPQKRTVIEPAKRGTIRDRFNLPLAINKVQYNAAVCYDQIREIPVITWRFEGKKKVKVYERRAYIESLSEMLGKELEMDPIKVEDLIYSKASIFPNTPFVLKEDIPESLYYKLRMQEKNWIGLQMQRSSKRYYPQGKVGSDIIGYIGSINERQYLTIAHEIQELKEFVKNRDEGLPVPLPKGFFSAHEVENRLSELREKAYSIHAFVGKSGIERKFDENLRGMYGKKYLEMESKGRFTRILPESTTPISGERILLSISSELQAYAEELLIQNERDRDRHFSLAGKNHDRVFSPWIKGGAIVATIPATGEVVAMASYPRFDPNDFILTDKDRNEKVASIYKWLESPIHLSNIWDGITPLEKEQLNYIEKRPLTWDLYLDMVLSSNGEVRKGLRKVKSVKHAVELQLLFHALLKFTDSSSPVELINTLYDKAHGHTLSPRHPSSLQRVAEALEKPEALKMRKALDKALLPIKHNDDKLLFLDLIRLVVDHDLFCPEILESMGKMTVSRYRTLNQSFCRIQREVKERVQEIYKERIFPFWRKKNFKAYLKEKREAEKERKTYARPYTDYLVEAEKKLFGEFWQEHKWKFFDAFIFGSFTEDTELNPFLFHLILKSKELEGELQESLKELQYQCHSLDLLKTFRIHHELTRPLWGYYYSLRKQTLAGLASAYYPKNGFGFGKSFAYERATVLGSLFKVVTGYEALKQTYLRHQDHNLPLRTLNPLTLIDQFNPLNITQDGMELGRYLDGTLITRQHKGGRMPRSHAPLGTVDFRTAVERSSNIYFSILAGEILDQPSDLQRAAEDFGFGERTGIDLFGEISGYVPDDVRFNQTGLYAFAIGQHSLVVTPLQTVMMLAAIGNGGALLKPQIVKLRASPLSIKEQEVELKNSLIMPEKVRTELMEGMRRVVMGDKGPVQPYRIRALYEHPKWIPEYKALQDQFIGKTSTAEFIYRPTLDREGDPLLCKEIWFGALSFKEGENYRFDMPDLSVVVYLKFGDYGKEAAPLAAQMIKKWREIQKRHKMTFNNE